MKMLFYILFLVFTSTVNAGYDTICEIEEIESIDWLFDHDRRNPINDTHQGLIQAFKIHNITGVKIEEPGYLEAEIKNGELHLSVSERYKNYEYDMIDVASYYHGRISSKFTFDCSDGTSEELKIKVRILDTNNHLPVFSKEVYEYKFGMPIPEGFEITQLLPIFASDVDFTNNKITFSTESYTSENFNFRRDGYNQYPDYYHFLTYLTAKKNITGPFREEFTITAKDAMEPISNSSAKVIVIVDADAETSVTPIPDDPVHPPVFSQSLYYADYTKDDELIMESPISLKFGEPNMILQQSDHTEYFEVSYESTRKEVEVKTKKPLPNSELEKRYLIFEIKATNEGLNLPGRANLVINLPGINSAEDKILVNDVCTFSHVYMFPIIMCFAVILLLLVFNVCFIYFYLNRQKINVALSNRFQKRTIDVNEIKVPL